MTVIVEREILIRVKISAPSRNEASRALHRLAERLDDETPTTYLRADSASPICPILDRDVGLRSPL